MTTVLEGFDPVDVEQLPEPARRYLRHSIADGAPPARSVELDLTGRIRLGRWWHYDARQRLNAFDGYRWEETASVAGFSIRGCDLLDNGVADVHHVAFGHVPVVSMAGPDVTRSSYARLACELVYTPAAFLDPRLTWDQLGWNTAVVSIPIPGERLNVTLSIGEEGELLSVRCLRWAKVGLEPWTLHRFYVEVLSEACTSGLTYPQRVRVGYSGSELPWPKGAFLEQTVVAYRPSDDALSLATPLIGHS
jgi:hypothetical protein